jgi:hypothetical protein
LRPPTLRTAPGGGSWPSLNDLEREELPLEAPIRSSDPAFVAPDSIPWLLLSVVGQRPGPTGGRKLLHASYVHRVRTLGGLAPSSGCAQASDVGAKALVPYSADYFFYEPVNR